MFKAFAVAGFVAAFTAGCGSGGQLSSTSIPAQPSNLSSSSNVAAMTPALGQAATSSVADTQSLASTAATTHQFAGRSLALAKDSTPGVSLAAGTLAFSDNFEADAIGKPAAGWSTVSGSFSVCQPAGSTHAYCQNSAAAALAVPNVAGSAAWTNYEFDADLLHGSAAGAVSVYARMIDAGHFYAFTVRSSGSTSKQIWQLWKYDGSRIQLMGRDFVGSSPLGQPIHVRLIFSGSTISAYAGLSSSPSLLATVTDASFASGGIALSTSDSTNSTFGNVAVTLASTGASPSPAPTQTPSSSGGVATFDGCPIFTPGDYYNADITNAAVDPHSANYLASLEAVDNTGFQAALGIEPLNFATSATPLLTVHPTVSWHTFPVKYPWASGYKIEDISDAHYLAINSDSCHLYEAYGAHYSNGRLSAYSGKDYDLRSPFKIGGGVMASGLSLFAGAVRHEDIATGIHYALNVDIWGEALCNCYTSPAAATDDLPYSGPKSAYEMPYGAHLRLKSSFDCSGWEPQSAAICAAMKHYGIYASDTDGHYANNNKLFFVNPTDGGSWNGGDLNALNKLRFSDFDVLKVGTIH